MTPELIIGIMLAIMVLVVIATIMVLYLGGNTTDGTYIIIYILLFGLIFASGMYFADHVEIINAENKIEQLQE